MKHVFMPLVAGMYMACVLASTPVSVWASVPEQATGVYINGTILTMDAQNRSAQAVAVKADKIIAVGSEDEIKAFVGSGTKVVDLKGATLMPGFYDSHSHFYGVGRTAKFIVDLNSPPIGKIRSIDDIISVLKKEAQDKPHAAWIRGRGYDDTLLKEKRHPTRYDLDKVSTERPIWISHSSGHLAVANSKALQMAGITRNTPSPRGGVIRKDPVTGEPNGVLEESAKSLVSKFLPIFSRTDTLTGIGLSSEIYASKGVTTANNGGATSLASVKNLVRAADQGLLKIRNVVCLGPKSAEQVRDLELDKTNLIAFGGIKRFRDGSIQGYTGYLSKPYHTPFQGDSSYRGYPLSSREVFAQNVKKIHDAGHQILIHGNGDAAIDDILYAFEKAQRENPRPDPRHVIIHSQMAREDQLDKMKKLGVIPSFFSLHTYYWGDRHRDIFMGPERAARMSPARSALDRGIVFTIHCDTPVVPQDPLLAVWSAVNRVSTSGKVIGPEQRISPLDALRAYTINAAYQNFQENMTGSIEPGKLADFVILQENPLTCNPMHIKDIKIVETIVGGQTVYRAAN